MKILITTDSTTVSFRTAICGKFINSIAVTFISKDFYREIKK